MNKKLSEKLAQYIPEEAVPTILFWMEKYGVYLKISKPRKSKRGDYRAPHRKHGHRISVNGNLNPFDFLITLIHEFAHLFTYNQFKHSVAPHGPQWKYQYKLAMKPFLEKKTFPIDIEQAIIDYMQNPAASTCSDPSLVKILKKYDSPKENSPQLTLVEELAEGDHFVIPKEQGVFQKGQLRRTRYLCKKIKSGKEYTVPGLLEVIKLDHLPKTPERGTLTKIEFLKEGDYFSLPEDDRIFELGVLRRTRYECKELKTQKIFTIPAQMEVYWQEKNVL